MFTTERRLTVDGYEYIIAIAPEDDGPEGHFASGDDAQDADDCARIREDAEWNPWAWCVVRVECSRSDIPEVVGTDYLGGCNYNGLDDFMADGYWDGMRDAARAECDAGLERLTRALCA